MLQRRHDLFGQRGDHGDGDAVAELAVGLGVADFDFVGVWVAHKAGALAGREAAGIAAFAPADEDFAAVLVITGTESAGHPCAVENAAAKTVAEGGVFGGIVLEVLPELVRQGVIQDWIATARIEIEQARLLVLKAAWMIDTVGAKSARKEIAAIKVAVPQMAERVIDHAIQSYGGAGVSQDSPLASMYAGIRTLRIVDGPDEVHIRDIARLEIKPYLS